MTDLVSVPSEVARTAALALVARAERGGGGSARGITIATALSSGVISPCELEELRDWHARNPDAVQNGASTLLAGLYGGAHARNVWPPSRLVSVDDTPVTAAARSPLATRLQKLSKQTNDTDHRLLLRLHAAATQALEEAIAQAGRYLVNRTKSASTRSKADGTRISAALQESQGKLSDAVLAALGLDEQDILDGRFDTFSATALALMSDAERRKLRAAAANLGLDAGTLEEQYGPTIDQRSLAATSFLTASLALLARQSLSGHTLVPAQGELSGPVPFGVVRNAFSIATRGASAVVPVETGPGSATAELLGRRLADAGTSLVEEILGTSEDVTGPVVQVTTWQVGDPSRPFEPHQDLDGLWWDTEDYPDALAWDPGEFPFTDVLEPGDHGGCECLLIYSWAPAEEPVGTSQGIAEGIEAGPGERRDLVSFQ